MRSLTDHEKRTIRTAAIAISIYLAAFYGFKTWRRLESNHSDYRQLIGEADATRLELRQYADKVLVLEKLRKAIPIDLSKISKATVVGEISAAIQAAAQSGGVQLGPLRESPARSSAKELASMQLEGSGQVESIMAFLHAVERLNFPLVLDSVQIDPDPKKPGAIKVSLTIAILNFEEWQKGGGGNV